MNNYKTINKILPDQGTKQIEVRKTTQYLMPIQLDGALVEPDEYNIYPICSLGDDKIFNGYESLARYIIEQKTVMVDGYVGVLWDIIISEISTYFKNTGLSFQIIETTDYLKSEQEINDLVKPFLGANESVWGNKCSLQLEDFYDLANLKQVATSENHDLNIIIGTGASFAKWDAPLIYFDLPKNEIQFRMRAGAITNLGSKTVYEPNYMYKRAYFVDWVLLNEHKKAILDRITVVADGQWADDVNWMFKTALLEGLNKISKSVIRVRPWFEPGAWGGQWIKNHIKNLNKEVVNYAWSFELIVPENGLVFESNGFLVEVSFDFLMFQCQEQVLGNHAATFGYEFPIRFDFLDTVDGGNLSIQVHPKLDYIQKEFGETITQDETYYILDCQQEAKVYLGFQENINPSGFRTALETSQAENKKLEIEDFVQSHQASKHDLFLIPNGTIHSSGKGNMVLEISATPYIFTFKMYDWLRLDLDGKPRPINIEHAFKNLDFTRKGERVQQELISKPTVLATGTDWQLIHLPTHDEHFYDVHRLEFTQEISIETNNCCHILMLVEGTSVLVKTADGTQQIFAYAETFVIPAAAKSYVLVNLGKEQAKVIKAFLK